MYNKRLSNKRVYPFIGPVWKKAANAIGGAYRNYRQRQYNRRTNFRSRNLFPYNPTAAMIRAAFRMGRPTLRSVGRTNRVLFPRYNRSLKRRKY